MEQDWTEVQKFYAGKSIFVTGVTGFVGKLIFVKLLQDCPVKSIFVLMRPKKEESIHTRLSKLVESEAFTKLRQKNPSLMDKIVPKEGDLTRSLLGLSHNNLSILCDEVNIVFHCAPTIKFTHLLDVALDINLNGTQRLLDVCLEMHHLVSFVYMSSTYAHCERGQIDEIFYPNPSINIEEALRLSNHLRQMSLQLAASVETKLLENRPNTYTLSKSLCETLLEKNKARLPISIVRPCIVTAAMKEPMEGWIDSFSGATVCIYFIGLGLLRTQQFGRQNYINYIPIDILVNTTILVAWSKTVTKRREEEGSGGQCGELDIYNCCPEKPFTVKEGFRLALQAGLTFPTNDVVFYPSLWLVESKIFGKILKFFLHAVPAYIIDSGLWTTGQECKLVRTSRKVHHVIQALEYFTTNTWTFSVDKMVKMNEELGERDRWILISTKNIDWTQYMMGYGEGIRRYLVKQSDASLPAAQKNLKRKRCTYCSLIIISLFFLIAIFLFVCSQVIKWSSNCPSSGSLIDKMDDETTTLLFDSEV